MTNTNTRISSSSLITLVQKIERSQNKELSHIGNLMANQMYSGTIRQDKTRQDKTRQDKTNGLLR